VESFFGSMQLEPLDRQHEPQRRSSLRDWHRTIRTQESHERCYQSYTEPYRKDPTRRTLRSPQSISKAPRRS
jgi:hypothetical protein